jgi:spermidine synthase
MTLNKHRTHYSSPFGLTALVFLLFFVSGMTGLVYEVVWTRMFTSVFGNTTYAISAVLAAFMGGLALGSFVIGRLVDKQRKLLKLYALLEVGIGIMALCMPLLLNELNSLYALVFQNLTTSTGFLFFIKTVLSFLILLIPTFLMGGTLPLLSKYLIRRNDEIGAKVGLLYSINTLGATAGCFLTGFVLLEAFGISNTIILAAVVNLVLGALFYILSLRFELPDAAPGQTTEEVEYYSPKFILLLMLGFGLTGFISLSFEVLWSRLLIFKLNTTVYAFSIMLTVFLVGLGAGSLLFTILEKSRLIKNQLKVFGVLESLIGLLGLISIFLFGQFEAISNLWESLAWRDQIYKQLLLAALIMLIPAILMGMTFPLVTHIYTRSVKRIGASVGKLYSVNTVGSILGSLITGFVLIQWLGTQSSLVLISILALMLGTAVLVAEAIQSQKKIIGKSMLPPALFWVLMGLLISNLPPDFLFQYFNIGEKQVNSQVEIIYANEGVECITTVHRYPDGNRVISTGSINVAGTDFTLRTTQKLQAHIPMLLHPTAKDVLQVGFGSGETSHILTTYDTKHVDIVEISKAVLETSSSYFSDINRGVTRHPKFRYIIMDGANYVALTGRKYDLILNDSIWPFYSGNSGLYTKEYFEDGKQHLNEGGIMTSWLPVEMPVESLKTLLETFHSVFPHVSLWMAVTHYNKHALIVGSLEPLEIDMEIFLERFEQYAQADLELINLGDPVDLMDAFKMDESGFNGWSQDAAIHSLNRPVLEFAPRFRNHGKDIGNSYDLIMKNTSSLLPYLKNTTAVGPQWPEMEQALERANSATKYLMQGLILKATSQDNFMQAFQKALDIDPQHPGVKYLINELVNLRNSDLEDLERMDYNNLIQQGLVYLENRVYDKAAILFNKALDLKPKSAIGRYNLGVVYYGQGRLDRAQTQLNSAIAERDDHAPSFHMRGSIMMAKGDKEKAISDYTQALTLDHNYWLAYNNRGITYASLGEFKMALNDFNKVIELNEDYATAYFNRGLLYQSGFQQLGLQELDGISMAINEYGKSIRLDPDYVKALSNRGMLYATLENYDLAIGDLSRVIALNPDLADAYYTRGLTYQMQGDETRSELDFQMAIQLDSSYKDRIQN